MRALTKGPPPTDVTAARMSRPPLPFNDLEGTTKRAIQTSLMREQGHLCAYCMQRIEAGTMKVEHWHSQSEFPDEGLDYSNMLGCCPGNEGEPYESQHCDTRKGSRRLSLNPARPEHHPKLRIRYRGDGTIRSDDPAFDAELDDVLNLNWPRLKSSRKNVIDAVMQLLGARPGPRSRGFVAGLKSAWSVPDAQGVLKPFCGVALYYLDKKLASFH